MPGVVDRGPPGVLAMQSADSFRKSSSELQPIEENAPNSELITPEMQITSS